MTKPKNKESKMACPEDAEKLYQATKDNDPFPNIPPALLNSADIHDYIEATGMVYPYNPMYMKSSSYEAQIGDEAIYWDENDQKVIVPLNEKPIVEVKPNSLVFFRTKQVFRLPSYMAIRFNLRITNVHRGLLLGTGPLVDPGFVGDLLIPIHNLTNNSYYFKGGDQFIWVEFTKVSPHQDWGQVVDRADGQSGIYEPFPTDKIDRKPAEYFEKANNGNSIQNAIPIVLAETQKIAKDAENQAGSAANSAKNAEDSAKKLAKLVTGGGILAAIAAVLSVIFGISPLITNSTNLSKDISKTISEFRKEYQGHLANEVSSQTKFEALDGKIATSEKISRQQIQLDAVEKKIGTLQNELNRYKALLTRPNPPRQNPK